MSLRNLPQRGWRWLRALAHLNRHVATSAHVASATAARLEILEREQRLLARQLTLPAADLWASGPPAPSGERASPRTHTGTSSVCRQESFETPWFHDWMARLGHAPRYHRKLWEFAFIGQALDERNAIRPGARGLGFGVGGEPLGAYFASRGCAIVATDLERDAPEAAPWARTGQFASSREALRAPGICPDDVFDANVTFRACDMNAVPADLTGFDFCWSACALEHLGSLEHGMDFIERSLDCLVPGGVAVHTTEFNVTSEVETLHTGPTVLYRRRDLEALARRLEARGGDMAPLDLDLGNAPLDRYVDLPPYLDAPHLRLAIEGYAATSVGLIIRKRDPNHHGNRLTGTHAPAVYSGNACVAGPCVP